MSSSHTLISGLAWELTSDEDPICLAPLTCSIPERMPGRKEGWEGETWDAQERRGGSYPEDVFVLQEWVMLRQKRAIWSPQFPSQCQVDSSDRLGWPQASELSNLILCICAIKEGHPGSCFYLLFSNVAFEYLTDHEKWTGFYLFVCLFISIVLSYVGACFP